MKSFRDNIKQIHYLKLEKGEDILDSIINYCKVTNINSGAIIGIGAVEKASLGYYDLKSKSYLTNNYDFNAEIINCTGNIAINKQTKEYIAHIHMTIGDDKGRTYGGHLLPNNPISVTGEFIIFETTTKLSRKIENEFQLLLLDL